MILLDDASYGRLSTDKNANPRFENHTLATVTGGRAWNRRDSSRRRISAAAAKRSAARLRSPGERHPLYRESHSANFSYDDEDDVMCSINDSNRAGPSGVAVIA
jgi:hypothetical protein